MVFLLTSGYSGTQSILKLIGLLILCALIIAASYYVTRLIGKREAGMSGSSNFQVIDAYRLTPNKYLQIIKIGNRFFCIAISKDDVRVICELNEEDITIRKKSDKMLSFKDILAKATGKKDSIGAEMSGSAFEETEREGTDRDEAGKEETDKEESGREGTDSENLCKAETDLKDAGKAETD
ncbi:MAG: flagellar biosynthetic protein FliO [Lachnospiraceae bacterium]|nr:flagellar biosynthetic protein FliO [Lachnospiraceae bacterium]